MDTKDPLSPSACAVTPVTSADVRAEMYGLKPWFAARLGRVRAFGAGIAARVRRARPSPGDGAVRRPGRWRG